MLSSRSRFLRLKPLRLKPRIWSSGGNLEVELRSQFERTDLDCETNNAKEDKKNGYDE